jgi:hypothetical protein
MIRAATGDAERLDRGDSGPGAPGHCRAMIGTFVLPADGRLAGNRLYRLSAWSYSRAELVHPGRGARPGYAIPPERQGEPGRDRNMITKACPALIASAPATASQPMHDI